MKHVALTVLVPVADGRGPALEAALNALPVGPQSPLAQISGLHVGRFAVLDEIKDPQGGSASVPGPFLFFSADVDGPYEAAVAAIATHCGELFRHCIGCPEPREARDFDAWFARHRIKDGWTIMPYAERTLPEVMDGIDAREQLGRFALEARELDPAALRLRFLEEFAS